MIRINNDIVRLSLSTKKRRPGAEQHIGSSCTEAKIPFKANTTCSPGGIQGSFSGSGIEVRESQSWGPQNSRVSLVFSKAKHRPLDQLMDSGTGSPVSDSRLGLTALRIMSHHMCPGTGILWALPGCARFVCNSLVFGDVLTGFDSSELQGKKQIQPIELNHIRCEIRTRCEAQISPTIPRAPLILLPIDLVCVVTGDSSSTGEAPSPPPSRPGQVEARGQACRSSRCPAVIPVKRYRIGHTYLEQFWKTGCLLLRRF